jgi:hypothetical protein
VLRTLVHAPRTPPRPRGPDDPPLALEEYHGPIGLLCSAVAQLSGDKAPRAFKAGMEGWLPPLSRPAYRAEPVTGAEFDSAIESVGTLPYAHRADLCKALQRIVAANAELDPREFDLLRLVSLTLGIATPSTGLLRIAS